MGIVPCILALSLAFGAPPPKVVKVRLGPNINSPTREGIAIPSPDGRYLYVVREGFPEAGNGSSAGPNVGDMAAKMKEFMKFAGQPGTEPDLAQLEQAKQLLLSENQTSWRSERQPDGSWGPLVKLPQPLNLPPGEVGSATVLSVMPDDNTLFVGVSRIGIEFKSYRADLGDGVERGAALALVHRVGNGWSKLTYLDIDGALTTARRNDFTLAPSGQALLLALQNKDSLGKHDIFVSVPDPKTGRWSHPKSLGSTINSTAEEMWPFMAPDGVTLYFASMRPGGFGGFDIWMSRRQGDGWDRWSEPVNLGPDVNTATEDLSMSVDATGEYAFVAEGKLTKEDIFQFVLPEAVKPLPVAFVRGKVRDPAGKPVAASIVYQRLRDGFIAGTANADPVTGEYQIALPIGEDYGFRAEASGYIAVSEHVDLTAAKTGETIERDLTLVPLAVGAVVRLNNVFFDSGKAVLLPASQAELDRVVAALAASPGIEIEIAGHTDAEGDAAANQALSDARASAVVAYLTGHGIAARRLVAKGYGKTKPVASNATDEGRQRNRRVELVILKR